MFAYWLQPDLLIVVSLTLRAVQTDPLQLCDHPAQSLQLLNLRGRGLLTFLIQGPAVVASQTRGS